MRGIIGVGNEESIFSYREFPLRIPVVKTWHLHCRGLGYDPWSGN